MLSQFFIKMNISTQMCYTVAKNRSLENKIQWTLKQTFKYGDLFLYKMFHFVSLY